MLTEENTGTPSSSLNDKGSKKKEREGVQSDMTLIKLQKLRRLGFLLMNWANHMENLPYI